MYTYPFDDEQVTQSFLAQEQLGAVPPPDGQVGCWHETVDEVKDVHEAAVEGAPEHVFANILATVQQSAKELDHAYICGNVMAKTVSNTPLNIFFM